MGRQAVIEGLHIVRSARRGRPTRWYIYAWRGGPQIRSVVQPDRPSLTRTDIAAIAKALEARVEEQKPGNTVAASVAAFRRTKYWASLTANTRKTWGVALDQIETKWAKVPMPVLADAKARSKIVAWQKEIGKTNARGADIAVMVLSTFFDWARNEGIVYNNPAVKIAPLYQRTDRAAVIWTDADLAAINEVAEQPLRDALALAVLTGLRRADLVALRWEEVGEDAIERTAAKRSRRKRFQVTIPRLAQLDGLLEELRTRPRLAGVDTVLVNSRGKSWTGEGLASSFHDARAKANGGQGIWYVGRDPETGEEQKIAKRLHDLRGTFATKLMTAPGEPLTDRDVASIMGWSEAQVGEIRKRYVDGKAMIVAMAQRLRKAGL